MHYYFQSLLTGLTTAFAWAPSVILLIMPLVGIYTGLIYVAEIGVLRILLVALLILGAGAGFVGLTSLCWNLKLRSKTQLICLLSGIMTLICVITIGYLSDNPSLHLGFSVIEVYLFIGPLFFSLLHVGLLLRSMVKENMTQKKTRN